jgi:hypothetical protein
MNGKLKKRALSERVSMEFLLVRKIKNDGFLLNFLEFGKFWLGAKLKLRKTHVSRYKIQLIENATQEFIILIIISSDCVIEIPSNVT